MSHFVLQWNPSHQHHSHPRIFSIVMVTRISATTNTRKTTTTTTTNPTTTTTRFEQVVAFFLCCPFLNLSGCHDEW